MGAASWQARKRASSKTSAIQIYGDVEFVAYPDSTQPGCFIYFGGLPDFPEMTFMQRYLREGDGFIDVGANEGMYTLLAAKLVGPTGDVRAFEPSPEYIGRLEQNVLRNRMEHVHVSQKAVGDEPGEVSFVLRGTGSRIKTSQDAGEIVTASVATLDDILPSRSWAMAKIDVEGAEPLVLLGAKQLISDSEPPVLMLEIQDRFIRRFTWTATQLVGWLDEHGYSMALYDVAGNALRLGGSELVERRTNLLAVARERLPEINDRLNAARPPRSST